VALAVDETGRSTGVIRIALKNHTICQRGLEVYHPEPIISALLIRVKRQEVLARFDTFPDPLLRQRGCQYRSSLEELNCSSYFPVQK